MDNYVNFLENFMATFATKVTSEACTKEGAEETGTCLPDADLCGHMAPKALRCITRAAGNHIITSVADTGCFTPHQ